MSPSTPPRVGRSAVVGVFESAPRAQQVVQLLVQRGTDERQIGVIDPADAAGQEGADGLLATRGVPEGETRFYADELRAGRALLVVDASQDYDTIRELLLQHGGYDVQSRGAELARSEGAGVAGGTGARPIDITARWDDVSSRYEMLWQQHYGTSDVTWQAVEPVYRYAFEVANQPDLRGRPWSEAEPLVRRAWESAPGAAAWDAVSGPIRDVWQDVAAEAATPEGGLERNIPPRE